LNKTLDNYLNKTLDDYYGVKVTVNKAYLKEVRCPFCFYGGYLYEFIIMLKNGKVGKKGKCPDCGQTMLLSTLTVDITPEDYGKFVYNYCRLPKGHKKFNWDKLKRRIWEAGISYRFWYGFNKAKREAHGLTE